MELESAQARREVERSRIVTEGGANSLQNSFDKNGVGTDLKIPVFCCNLQMYESRAARLSKFR